MARVRGFLVVLFALAVLIVAGCGGGSSGEEPVVLGLTDPGAVPTATPNPEAPVFRFEGGVVVPPAGAPTAVTGVTPTSRSTYTVEPGDSCVAIANQFGITVEDLREANPAIDAGCTNLISGQTLVIPGAASGGSPAQPTPGATNGGRTYTIQSGDTCFGIAQSFGVSVDDLVARNGLDCDALQPGTVITIP